MAILDVKTGACSNCGTVNDLRPEKPSGSTIYVGNCVECGRDMRVNESETNTHDYTMLKPGRGPMQID